MSIGNIDKINEGWKWKMKLTKKQIGILNNVAKVDFDKAKSMLEGINMVLGTDYDWLAKRVVWFEGTIAHDAWAWAD